MTTVLDVNLKEQLSRNHKRNHHYIIERYLLNSTDADLDLKIKEVVLLFEEVYKTLEEQQRRYLVSKISKYSKIDIILKEKRVFLAKEILKEEDVNYSGITQLLHILKTETNSFEDIKNVYEVLMKKYFFFLKHKIYNENVFNFNEEELIKTSEYIKNSYEDNKKEIIKNCVVNALLSTAFSNLHKTKTFLDDVYISYFTHLYSDIMKSENIGILDAGLLNAGSYSVVYKLGEKILKIGNIKNIHELPNSKYILQPVLRNYIGYKDTDNCYVELMEYVNISDSITEGELYTLYKNLREEGIIWTDPRNNNVGKLLKDNYCYINGEVVNINQTNNGFDKNNVNVLKKGDLVVIDIDHLYKETPDLEITNGNFMYVIFETRYQNEKSERIRKK